jgi:colanic acid biosynthesis glycosyl transferase WcaI
VKVLVVSQYFWPEDFRVNDLVAGFVERGHEVTVLTGLPNYPGGRFFPGYGLKGPWREHYAGATVLRVPLLARGGAGGIRLLLNYLSFVVFGIWGAVFRLRGPFDFIFVSEVSPITVGIPAAFARWRFRAPILFWVLDLWPETLSALGVVRSPRILNAVSALVRWIYARCSRVLVQSRAFVPEVLRHGVAKERVLYFPNWVESAYISADTVASAATPAVPRGFTVMFAGNIGEAQDFPAIIDAAELLKNTEVCWLIVGDGRIAERAKQDVVSRGLQHRVRFLGRHPADQMPALFAGADALLVSLRRERIFALTIPGKVQSYLASGRPVLAMLDGEGAKVVEEARAGFVCAAGDAQALAANVLKLAALPPEDREKLGANGRRYAKEHFERQHLFDQLQDWAEAAVREERESAAAAKSARGRRKPQDNSRDS